MLDGMNSWGWGRYAAGAAPDPAPGLLLARVVGQHHHHYHLVCAPDARRITAQVSGAFAYRAAVPADYPTVGDWVRLSEEQGQITDVLPRRTVVSRHAAGDESLEQVIVANVDVVLLVFALDGARGFTIGLLERACTTAWNSGARPLVVLNKVDLAEAAARDQALRDARAAAPGVEVVTVSAREGDGVAALLELLASDETVGMLGKSGVGKSALLNALARVRETDLAVREGTVRRGDLQGRHTTTDKQLYRLPGGPLIVDVPGLRELQLWADGDDLEASFPDVEELASQCRFTDCSHSGEPGCRIAAALESGELAPERWERYQDLQRELAYLNRRRDDRARQEEQQKWKKIAEFARQNKGTWRGRS